MDTMKKDGLNDEIAAVIAAAIASMETRPGHRLVVKSIRRVPQTAPAWNTAGRAERLGRHMNSH